MRRLFQGTWLFRQAEVSRDAPRPVGSMKTSDEAFQRLKIEFSWAELFSKLYSNNSIQGRVFFKKRTSLFQYGMHKDQPNYFTFKIISAWRSSPVRGNSGPKNVRIRLSPLQYTVSLPRHAISGLVYLATARRWIECVQMWRSRQEQYNTDLLHLPTI